MIVDSFCRYSTTALGRAEFVNSGKGFDGPAVAKLEGVWDGVERAMLGH